MAEYNRASQFLQKQQGNMSQYTPNFKPATDAYMNSIDKAVGGYKDTSQKGFDTYKGQMNQNVGMMKEQVQMQIASLQKQLSNNQAKYQSMADNQKSRINRDYQQQNEAIDQQTFNQMKYNSAMGQQRGVSNSAQQTAMDTHAGQISASLFNQNSQNRGDALNDVDAKLMQQMVDLDNQFTSSYTSIMSNAMNQQMAHNAQMAGKELEFSSAMADKILGLEMQKGQIQFETKMEEEKAKKALAQQIMQMTFSDYQKQDDRSFSADEAQKQRDFTASENAKDRALQQALASARASGGGSGGKGSGGGEQEQLFWEANYQHAMEMLGMTPNEATDWANKQTRIRYDSKNYANETSAMISAGTGSKYTNTASTFLNNAKNMKPYVPKPSGSMFGGFSTMRGNQDAIRKKIDSQMKKKG